MWNYEIPHEDPEYVEQERAAAIAAAAKADAEYLHPLYMPKAEKPEISAIGIDKSADTLQPLNRLDIGE